MLRTIKQIVLTAVVLVVVAGCGDSESQRDEETGSGPREIANKVIACYADMKTYSSDGDTVSDVDISNFDMQGILESMPEDMQNNMGDLEKAKVQMPKQMEAATKAMKHMKVTMTETHRNIMINPDLAEDAFLPVQTAVTSD